MRTLYSACLSRLGLSQAGAAALHDVRLDTVKSWASGRYRVPAGAWNDLRTLESRIVDHSEAMREAWDANPGAIELDDSEAGGRALIAVADFVLGLPADVPVAIGRTAATALARQARRPN